MLVAIVLQNNFFISDVAYLRAKQIQRVIVTYRASDTFWAMEIGFSRPVLEKLSDPSLENIPKHFLSVKVLMCFVSQRCSNSFASTTESIVSACRKMHIFFFKYDTVNSKINKRAARYPCYILYPNCVSSQCFFLKINIIE